MKQSILRNKKRYRIGNLKKNVLTYEEIISGVLKQIPVTQDENVLWAAHVSSAIELTSKGQLVRMAVAELAERACVIFHGSHRITYTYWTGKNEIRELKEKEISEEIINGD